MDSYRPPIKDMMFVMHQILDWKRLAQVKKGDIDQEMSLNILTAAGKLASEVLAPLNHSGDRQGCSFQNGEVKTPQGFRQAYAAYRDNGWNSVSFDPQFGGQGLPRTLSFPIQEMWQSANLAFGLCPLLNQGAVESIELHASELQKQVFLTKLISGEWTGTMNLTEPQAGTDLGAIRTQAQRQPDGSYRLSGQKIFITYGEHDFSSNIIHSVLARTPNAASGSKGLSLFIVPKYIPDDQGGIGRRNDVVCSGIESKLGIHASPTCVMNYGEHKGALAYLVGEEMGGLKCMFTMMNNARLSVGLQGVAVAERAYQKALTYAREDRIQSAPIERKPGQPVHIIEHPDVARMLLEMKSQIEAGRALAYEAAYYLDLSRSSDAAAQARVDLLTPVVKGWCTDMAVRVTERGKQIHGGIGYIEASGVPQYIRDANILTVYEGTNGIQAQDLLFRKILRDEGQAARAYFDEGAMLISALKKSAVSSDIIALLENALAELVRVTSWVLKTSDIRALAGICVPYMNLFGLVAGALLMGRSLLALVSQDTTAWNKARIASAVFYMWHILPQYQGWTTTIVQGSTALWHNHTAHFA